MLSIEIKSNLEEFMQEDLKEIKLGYYLITKKLSEKIQQMILEKVKNKEKLKYTPVKTGYLRDNFKGTAITKRYEGYHGKVFNETPYAEFIEFGKNELNSIERFKSDKRRLAHQRFLGESGFSFEELSSQRGFRRAMLKRATEDTENLVDYLFEEVWREKSFD